METKIQITVTAFSVADGVKAEKSASTTAVVDDTGRNCNDWGDVIAKLISRATQSPVSGAKPMAPKMVDKYIAAKEVD